MRATSFTPILDNYPDEKKCYELPKGTERDEFNIKEIEIVNDQNHYTITAQDSNFYLVFDYDGNVIIHIPDNLTKGVGFLATNIGTGSIELVMDGLEKLRGWPVLTDVNSFITAIKITDTLWQSSERL